MERRYHAAGVQLRNDSDENTPTIIEGYAAVYYDGTRATEYEMWPGGIERIMPGAFDANLDDDIRALFDHRSHMILGRNTSGTLRLSLDERGLRYELDVPNTTHGRDVAESLRRGDVNGSSFAFRSPKTEWLWDEPVGDGEYSADIRQITSFGQLFDVGPVTYPAYTGTSASSRDAQSNPFASARDEYESARKAAQQATDGMRARYAARAALVELD